MTNNGCYKANKKRTPIGIQLHTIGTGQGTAQAVADYWNGGSVSACVTYIVDADTDGKVLQCLPEDVRTWADGGYGNNNLITFEICESDHIKYTSGASYTITNAEKFKADIMRGYNTAVLLCADICKRYGWNPKTKLASGLYLISSHDEGRRAGLSTGHFDPTHVWDRFGLTMDKFRDDVEKKLKEPKTDKIWLGWTKRESGDKGFRQTNGSSGTSYGRYQFDYRYALVPFLQDCVNHSNRYDGFQTYIKYGVGSQKLVNNKWLAELWVHLCDAYPEEFEALQDRFAYQEYYLPAVAYMQKLFGIDIHSKSPAVKGSLFSMAIRSGTESGARKFTGCTNKTSDADMLRIAYASYGDKDNQRWTKANQYGDAMKALESGEYTLVSADKNTLYIKGDILPKEEKWYRIGTAWTNGKCVNQAGAFQNLDKAKALCDEITHDKGLSYKVFDYTGKVVYNGKYEPEKYTVQSGSFSIRENAEKLCEAIKSKGIDAFVVKVGNAYKVQCGVFLIKENAEKIMEMLLEFGFDAVIK